MNIHEYLDTALDSKDLVADKLIEMELPHSNINYYAYHLLDESDGDPVGKLIMHEYNSSIWDAPSFTYAIANLNDEVMMVGQDLDSLLNDLEQVIDN